MLDPDPDVMNADPKPCFKLSPGVVFGALGWGENAGEEAPLLLRQRVHRHLVRAARPHLTLTLGYHTPGIFKIYVTRGFRLFKINVGEPEPQEPLLFALIEPEPLPVTEKDLNTYSTKIENKSKKRRPTF